MEFPVANERVGNIYRRIIMNRLESYAVTRVKISGNTSIMTEEMIAFNLAWLHLGETPGARRSNGPVAGAFTLDVRNEGATPRVVTGADLRVADEVPFALQDARQRIAILAPQEHLDLVCTVDRGTGAEHCKFAPVRRVGLRKKKEGWRMVVHALSPGSESTIMQRAAAELALLTDKLSAELSSRYPSTDPDSGCAASRETPTLRTGPDRSTS